MTMMDNATLGSRDSNRSKCEVPAECVKRDS